MKQTIYIDLKGVVEFFQRRGKTASADLFSEPSNLAFFAESEVVRHGHITWIPSSWMVDYFKLVSASPAHAEESMRELESEAIQWIPMEEDTVEGIQQSYERAQKIN